MTHVREQLRQAIYDTISTDPDVLALVELNDISIERVNFFQQNDDIHEAAPDTQFPAINIIVNDDETNQAFMANCSKYEVEQEVNIEVYVNKVDEYGKELDSIIVPIQKALFNDIKLGLNITGVKYNRSRMSKDLSETLFAARVLSYTYEYRGGVC